MGSPNSNNKKNLLTLSQAAQELGVTIDALLQWNDFNILKPTITLSGEVGYTQEQIDKFLAIRQLPSQQGGILPVKQDAVEAPKFAGKSRRFPSRLILPLSAMAILLIVVVTQQGKLKSLLGHNQLISQKEADSARMVLSSQTSKSGFSEFAFMPAQMKNKILTEPALESKPSKVPFTSLKSMASGDASVFDSKKIIDNIGYSQIGNLPKNADTENNLFDARGNIKGETTGSNILAMAFGTTGLVGSANSLKPVTDSNVLLTFLGLGLLSFVIVLRKQLLSPAKAKSAVTFHNFPDKVEERKVIEVNQKTDGTVALYFQGREYKLCKPDLDSESDQFIERLMGLATTGAKELDYDISSDSQISFNAPLSKLVTRLGFVGLKRDLFFPRTSKNSVLFRRYISQEDLISMNVTADQIISEFSSNI
jgi:hypothetical protein